MNKFILIFLFITFASFGATNSLAISKKEKIFFTEEDIQIDTTSIELRTFEKNFKSKYTDDKFIYEFKSKEKNAWDRFKEWLAGIFRNIFSLSNKETSMNFVEVLMKVLAILVVIFVIYLIVKSIMNKEGQWIFGKNSDKKIIDYTEIEKNIHAVDFEKLIKNTLKSGEKRLSIRYYYLWLLKKMSAKEIIIWDIEKTNSDYLYEIKNQTQKDEFAYLSYLYNYIWYGEFDIDDAAFTKAKNSFEKAIQAIK
ncbi:DUF4129 domain-containing protein [Flavobacterium sp.]|uniref:DUF4129 domain-containing protein n=1 Tax=Flavobacterium sp. TaxID=239 RepID=UPI0037538B10